ncbi:FAD/NAD(P)-binding protein [Paraburkholderia unamae]|uniref:FAD/NAD(P)-binding protein n=1 Tax=Paraburkholderia unamae TaxID=219649 RepID=UPI001CC3B911|nr:FAD/NAD(P)-binding protein [Paraburkholderia unamae]
MIGLGPRGLSVLERILEHANRLPAGARLHIDAIDPGECGQGSHPARQPDHLLTNTLASQVTMFAPDSVAGGSNGATLVDWAIASGYRRFGQRFLRVGDDSGAAISEFDYLPRSLLGEYLSWVADRVTRQLPDTITFTHHRTRVREVQARDSGFRVWFDNGYTVRADYVFLTTGHGHRRATAEDRDARAFVARHARDNPALGFFASPYPVTDLTGIASHATVAIQGFGLSAHDVISELTVGRGGRFVGNERALRYEPSGREPKLLVFSRNCLPFAARGVNQKGLTGRHQARFFTPAAVRELADAAGAARGDRRVDFEAQVLPLIVTEMAYAYRSAASLEPVDAASFAPTADELRAIHAILWPLKGQRFASEAAFRAFFDAQFDDDLAHAFLGNVSSPVKAATDALRDTREALREAIEYGAATPASHRYFVEEFNAITNRIAFGPPKQRNVEFAALRAAGVLDLGGGPGARVTGDSEHARFRIDTRYPDGDTQRFADVLIAARLDTWSPLTDATPLTANLVANGLIRPYRNGDYHPGGIDIDRHLRPIGRDGTVQTRIWAIGFPVEGPHFYTHALPRPRIASRQTADAERAVLQLFDAIARDSAALPAADATDEAPATSRTADLEATA